MLSKPNAGWSTITIGAWSDRCSYLDDVPFELLRALIRFCVTRMPAAVTFDAEGYEYTVLFTYSAVHIISDQDDGYSLHSEEEVNCDALAAELSTDIQRDIDEWTQWLSYRHLTEQELATRKAALLRLCEVLLSKTTSTPQ